MRLHRPFLFPSQLAACQHAQPFLTYYADDAYERVLAGYLSRYPTHVDCPLLLESRVLSDDACWMKDGRPLIDGADAVHWPLVPQTPPSTDGFVKARLIQRHCRLSIQAPAFVLRLLGIQALDVHQSVLITPEWTRVLNMNRTWADRGVFGDELCIFQENGRVGWEMSAFFKLPSFVPMQSTVQSHLCAEWEREVRRGEQVDRRMVQQCQGESVWTVPAERKQGGRHGRKLAAAAAAGVQVVETAAPSSSTVELMDRDTLLTLTLIPVLALMLPLIMRQERVIFIALTVLVVVVGGLVVHVQKNVGWWLRVLQPFVPPPAKQQVQTMQQPPANIVDEPSMSDSELSDEILSTDIEGPSVSVKSVEVPIMIHHAARNWRDKVSFLIKMEMDGEGERWLEVFLRDLRKLGRGLRMRVTKAEDMDRQRVERELQPFLAKPKLRRLSDKPTKMVKMLSKWEWRECQLDVNDGLGITTKERECLKWTDVDGCSVLDDGVGGRRVLKVDVMSGDAVYFCSTPEEIEAWNKRIKDQLSSSASSSAGGSANSLAMTSTTTTDDKRKPSHAKRPSIYAFSKWLRRKTEGRLCLNTKRLELQDHVCDIVALCGLLERVLGLWQSYADQSNRPSVEWFRMYRQFCSDVTQTQSFQVSPQAWVNLYHLLRVHWALEEGLAGAVGEVTYLLNGRWFQPTDIIDQLTEYGDWRFVAAVQQGHLSSVFNVWPLSDECERELRHVCAHYVQEQVVVDRRRARILLPAICRLSDRKAVLSEIMAVMPTAMQKDLRHVLDRGGKVKYAKYDAQSREGWYRGHALTVDGCRACAIQPSSGGDPLSSPEDALSIRSTSSAESVL